MGTYHPTQDNHPIPVQPCESCGYVVAQAATSHLKFRIACPRCRKPAQFGPPYTAFTTAKASIAVPTAEGITDAIQAIEAACAAKKWTLIAPDGRVWMDTNPMILLAALSQIIAGRDLQFEPPGIKQ